MLFPTKLTMVSDEEIPIIKEASRRYIDNGSIGALDTRTLGSLYRYMAERYWNLTQAAETKEDFDEAKRLNSKAWNFWNASEMYRNEEFKRLVLKK